MTKVHQRENIRDRSLCSLVLSDHGTVAFSLPFTFSSCVCGQVGVCIKPVSGWEDKRHRGLFDVFLKDHIS